MIHDVKARPAVVPDDPSELGPRLRAIRLREGVGLRELARRLDLSPSSISQIETGKIRPSVRTLYALASEFGVTVDEVLFSEPTAAREAPVAPGFARPVGETASTGPRAAQRPVSALNSG